MVLDAAFSNSGQGGRSLKKIFIHDNIYEEFKELLVQGIENMSLGDPMDENTYIGPLSNKDHLVEAIEQVIFIANICILMKKD